MKTVVVTGSFDDIRLAQVRFLEEASKRGDLYVLIWSDRIIAEMEGKPPKFPQEERSYILDAICYVRGVSVVESWASPDELPVVRGIKPDMWVVDQESDTPGKRYFCASHKLEYQVIDPTELEGFPVLSVAKDDSPMINLHVKRRQPKKKKVLATGCFDWLHSGHIRFFEETSSLGELTVVVGNDENIRLLKGNGHPMFCQDERCYMVQAIRFVKQALISSGQDWMDAEPEIETIKPDIYVVNEDGVSQHLTVVMSTTFRQVVRCAGNVVHAVWVAASAAVAL
jgi:cytidyltransferase-like protein